MADPLHCTACQGKQVSHIQPGFQCEAQTQGSRCSNQTTAINCKLCDSCAQSAGLCRICKSHLRGGVVQTTTAGIKFVVVKDNDIGRTIKGMLVGEQVHIYLSEDIYSGAEWDIKSCSYGLVRQQGSQFTPSTCNPQYGDRKFVVDIKQGASGSVGTIELHEVHRQHQWWWWGMPQPTGPIPNGQTFKVHIQVN